MSSKTSWIVVWCAMLHCGIGAADNLSPPYYTGEVLPTPQEARYGDGFVGLGVAGGDKASACLVLGRGLTPGSPAVAELLARVQEFEGVIDLATEAGAGRYSTVIRLGTYDDGEFAPPDKPEGYSIEMVTHGDQREVHAIGRDAQGTDWACRSLIQLITHRDGKILLREASVRDFPHTARRGFLMPMSKADAYHLSWAATFKLNCVAPGMVIADWRAPTEAELLAMERVGEYLQARGMECIGRFAPVRGKPENKIAISRAQDVERLAQTIRLILERMGGVMICFDDTCYPMHPEDVECFGTAAKAHIHLMKALDERLRADFPQVIIQVCPPFYWNPRGPYAPEYPENGEEYLRAVGREFPPYVDIVWTGPLVTSPKMTSEDLAYWRGLTGRRPFYWDNFFHGGHTGQYDGWYYFDLKDFAAQFPPEFTDELAGFLMATGGWWCGPCEVLLATVSDYLWNPKAFEAEASRRAAMEQVAGPGMGDLLLEWREKMVRFDPYVFHVTRAAQRNLPQLREWLAEAQETQERVLRDCPNAQIPADPLAYFVRRIERFVGSVERANLAEDTAREQETRAQAEREVGLDDDALLLTAFQFSGGRSGKYAGSTKPGEGCEPRWATWIYGTPTGRRELTGEFHFPQALTGVWRLTICGQDDEHPDPCPIEIELNGRVLHRGKSGFVRFGWSRREWPLEAGLLRQGSNVLRIRNLETKSMEYCPPWFMLNYAMLRATQ